MQVRFVMNRIPILAFAAVCLIFSSLFIQGCATGQKEPEEPPVIFPLPPEKPRVQYLGFVSSPADLPGKRNSFAEFVLGPEPILYPLAKPISATLRGDRLYICDTVFNSVLVYDLVTGDAHPLAGDRGVGKIKQPNNLAFDEEGRLYIADKVRQAVLVYNPDETYRAAWGRPGEVKPAAVAVRGGEIFVAMPDTHEIEVWSREDGSLLRKFGGLGKEPGKFFIPTQIAIDGEGHLYITDTGNFRVQKVTADGDPLEVIGGPGRTFGKFAWPKGLDVDAGGCLYVADSRFANVQIFDDEGKLLLFFGGPGPQGGNIDLPAGLSIVPWPSIPMLERRLADGFEAESLAIIVNQQGPAFVNFFAIARNSDAF